MYIYIYMIHWGLANRRLVFSLSRAVSAEAAAATTPDLPSGTDVANTVNRAEGDAYMNYIHILYIYIYAYIHLSIYLSVYLYLTISQTSNQKTGWCSRCRAR